jgi:ABC-type uncharacterized transport system ATPase subunit
MAKIEASMRNSTQIVLGWNMLRNKMDDEWLNHRMICYIERGVFASLSNDDILHHFQELKSHKKKLIIEKLHHFLVRLLPSSHPKQNVKEA